MLAPSDPCVLHDLWARYLKLTTGSEEEETNMLSWVFATEGVCVRGGPHVAKADNE